MGGGHIRCEEIYMIQMKLATRFFLIYFFN